MQNNYVTPNSPVAPVRRGGPHAGVYVALALASVLALVVLGLGGWYFGGIALEKHAVSAAADEYWHALEIGDWATLYQYAPANGPYDTPNRYPLTVRGGLITVPGPSPDMPLPGLNLPGPKARVVSHRIDSVRVIDSTHAQVTVAYRLAIDRPFPAYQPYTPSPNRNPWNRTSESPIETRASMSFCCIDGKWRLDGSRLPRMRFGYGSQSPWYE